MVSCWWGRRGGLVIPLLSCIISFFLWNEIGEDGGWWRAWLMGGHNCWEMTMKQRMLDTNGTSSSFPLGSLSVDISEAHVWLAWTLWNSIFRMILRPFVAVRWIRERYVCIGDDLICLRAIGVFLWRSPGFSEQRNLEIVCNNIVIEGDSPIPWFCKFLHGYSTESLKTNNFLLDLIISDILG